MCILTLSSRCHSQWPSVRISQNSRLPLWQSGGSHESFITICHRASYALKRIFASLSRRHFSISQHAHLCAGAYYAQKGWLEAPPPVRSAFIRLYSLVRSTEVRFSPLVRSTSARLVSTLSLPALGLASHARIGRAVIIVFVGPAISVSRSREHQLSLFCCQVSAAK